MTPDPNLLIHLADTNTKNVRDRLLVLLAGLTQLSVKELLSLTVGGVRELVASANFPHKDKLLRTLAGLEKHLHQEGGDPILAFASRKHDPATGSHKPIGREQAWRVVKGALATLKGRRGAFRALRALGMRTVETSPLRVGEENQAPVVGLGLCFFSPEEAEEERRMQAAWRLRHPLR